MRLLVTSVVGLTIGSFSANVGATPTPIQAIDALKKGTLPSALCFGWSQKTETFVCHGYDFSVQTGGEFRVEFVGKKGGRVDYFKYDTSVENMNFFGKPSQKKKNINTQALDKVRARLQRDGFQPLARGAFRLTRGRTLKVGTVRVRIVGKGHWLSFPANSKKHYQRNIGDVHVRCGRRWRLLKLYPSSSLETYSPVVKFYILPGNKLLIAATLHWRAHGSFGATTAVTIETAKTLCAKRVF